MGARFKVSIFAGLVLLLPAALAAQTQAPKPTPAIQTMLDDAAKTPDPAQKIDALKKVVDAAKAAKDAEGQAEADDALGAASKSDAAVGWYQLATSAYKSAGNGESEGNSWRRLGMAYATLGKNDKALNSYQLSIAIARKIHSRKLEARVLINIGNVSASVGRLKQAVMYYNLALPLARESGSKEGEGIALLNLGSMYESMGEMHKALDYYLLALQAKKKADNARGGVAWAMSAIGRLYGVLGEVGKGLDYLNQALMIDRQNGDTAGEAMCLSNLGDLHRDLGEYKESLSEFIRMLSLKRQLGDRQGEEWALIGIGSAHFRLGDTRQALDDYQQALTLARSIGDRRAEATLQSNIGSVYVTFGDHRRAIELFRQSAQIANEEGNRDTQSISLDNVGEAYNALGKWRDAIVYFGRALPLAKEVDHADLVAHLLHQISIALASDKRPQLAIVLDKQSVNTYQAMREHMRELPKADQEAFAQKLDPTYRHLADLLIKQGRLREAEKVMNLLKGEENFEFVARSTAVGGGVEGRIETIGAEGGWWAKYQTLQDRALKIDSEEFDLTQKSSTLRGSSSLTAVQKADLSQMEARLKELDAQKEVIDKAADAYFDEVGKQASTLSDSLRKEAEERVRQTGDELPSLLERIHRDSKEKVGAVYALASSDELDFLVVTYAGRAHVSVPVTSDDLNKMISAFRKQLMNPYADPKPAGEKLYHLVFEKLIHQLQESGCTRVVWCLDGTLRYVPIGALWDGSKYLIERGDYTMFDPLNLDRISSEASKNLEAAGFAATEGKGNIFAPLPGADKELKSVVKDASLAGFTGAVPGRAYENKGFDESNLTSAMKAEQFSVLHIATHFNVGKDFNSSNLLLGDGNLLSLRQFTDAGAHGRLGHLDLVCLSACDTAESFGDAAGAGSQFSSFVSLTLKDGASSVVASLWPVSDESTPVLMKRFYANWMAHKELGKAEALRTAQLSLLQGDPKFSHPYYWAPFILFGNWK